MKASSLGLGALLAAVLLHSGGATSIEANLTPAIEEAKAAAQLIDPPKPPPPAVPTAMLTCTFWPLGGGEQKATVPVLMQIGRAPTHQERLTLGAYEATLTSEGGDGGEPGMVRLKIEKGGALVFGTVWQSGDFIDEPGRRSGLHSVNNPDPESPGSAELQFSCETQ